MPAQKQQYSVCVSVIVSKTVLLNRQNINTRNIPCAAYKTAQRCVAIEFNKRHAISAREGDGMEKQKMKSTIKRLYGRPVLICWLNAWHPLASIRLANAAAQLAYGSGKT